jgi:FMN phosphatase YigB (HAD superfamily)
MYLEHKGRPPATAMPRGNLRERLDLFAAEHVSLELEEGAARVWRDGLAVLRDGLGEPPPPVEGVPFSVLRERVLEMARGHDVVGFDIFNTLVVRSVEGEWLKTAVARALHARLRGLVHPSCLPTPAQVRQRRLELELEIAGERMARGEDNEVDYEELVVRWAGTWVSTRPYRDELAAWVRQRELELERLALRPSPGIQEVLAALKAQGKRLIFISDMYLSAPVLRELLRHCGLDSYFDAGYASTDLGLRKASGRIFPRVLELEGLRPEQLLFIGDDENSDNVQPRLLGIRTLRIDDPQERQRRRRLEAAQRAAEHNPFWSAHYVDEVMRTQAPSLHEERDATWRVGQTLAPSLVGFVLDVIEKCERLGIERVFFLAREGLTFLKIFSLLRHSGVHTRVPEARYLFVSRAATILASMRTLSWEELHRFWRQYNQQSLRQLLQNLSLPADEFLPLAAECGLTDADRPLREPSEDEAFHRFLTSRRVRAVFTVHRDRARARLAHYLEYRGLMGRERVALVDIGWKGSMQDSLTRTFEGDPRFPELHGFYLAYVNDGQPLPPRSFKYGYLADTRRHDLEEKDLFRNTAIYEMVTTANHGSTVGYGTNPWAPSVPMPVLVHHDLEKENSARYFRRAQEAIYEYARDFARLYALLPFTASELKPGVLHQFLRYTRYPTWEEAEEFLRYSHVESFGVHEITTFGFKVDLRKVLARRSVSGALDEVWQSFMRNLWRDAVVRRSGIPLANVAYDAWFTYRQVK